MIRNSVIAFICGAILITGCQINSAQKCDGWISLFDGKTFEGWKAGQNKETFTISDNAIVVHGDCCHLYYDGSVENANFKNFEFKADVMTKPGANSGIYFHTEYQDDWPSKGYEVQVNNSHSDWRRTGGLYAVADVKESPAKDNEWFTEHIIVKDKHITVLVNGKVVTDYTEPDGISQTGYPNMPGRKISSGTFALQGHDPGSEIHYKNIMVKPLP